MKLTKFEHACFVVEQDKQSIIVDPGEFTTDLSIPDTVIAVVITHEHQDHLSESHIQAIVAKNPEAVVITHKDSAKNLGHYSTQTVVANEGIKIGNFTLEFFGGEHAVIDSAIPVIANLGVMINDSLYYPGDSFALPERPVKVLALPVSAPWMKISEAADFVRAVQPEFVFPTHDAILSDVGKGLPDRLIPKLTSVSYQRLAEPIEI